MSTSTKRGGTADDGAAAATRADEGETLVVHGRVVAKAGPAASSWRRSRCARPPSPRPYKLRTAPASACAVACWRCAGVGLAAGGRQRRQGREGQAA